jgi:hypothetical protein
MRSAVVPQARHPTAAVPRWSRVASAVAAVAFKQGPIIVEPRRNLFTGRSAARATGGQTRWFFSGARRVAFARLIVSASVRIIANKPPPLVCRLIWLSGPSC